MPTQTLARARAHDAVNWPEIRRRLDAAGHTSADSPLGTAESAQKVLEERGRRLARVPAAPQDADRLEVISFALADETYAIETRYVLEVFRLLDMSPLPGALPPVCGVTAWRGELLTMFDLRGLLGLSVAALNDLARVIVVGGQLRTFGILADAVRDIVTLSSTAVREPPDGVAAQREYLRGITSDAMLVLDADALLQLAGSHPL